MTNLPAHVARRDPAIVVDIPPPPTYRRVRMHHGPQLRHVAGWFAAAFTLAGLLGLVLAVLTR